MRWGKDRAQDAACLWLGAAASVFSSLPLCWAFSTNKDTCGVIGTFRVDSAERPLRGRAPGASSPGRGARQGGCDSSSLLTDKAGRGPSKGTHVTGTRECARCRGAL